MPSRVSLMNRALRLIGGQTIAAGDEEALEATLATEVFNDIRDTVLADFSWRFATKWAQLPMLNNQPVFGTQYAYRLPTDAIRIIDVRGSGDMTAAPAVFYISGRDVLTSVTPCYARYVSRIEDTSLYPPHFCECLIVRLAAELAPAIGPDSRDTPLQLRKLYIQSLDTARLVDAAQELPEKIDPIATNAFLSARN